MLRARRASDTLVYLGTIDDVVLRHPWPDIAIGPDFLTDTIIDHVLFGAPLLINDGYLVNHPLARADLMAGERSLLLALVRKGFIKVLTRVDDLDALARMPGQMARQGIQTFGERIASDEWQRFELILRRLGDELRPLHNTLFWPPVDMGDGFRRLLENADYGIASKGFESLGLRTRHRTAVRRLLFNSAARLAKDSAAARTKFEEMAVEEAKALPTGDDREFVSDMMGFANEVYHFNFAINLDYAVASNGLTVLAETRMSRAFDDLLRVEEPVLNFERDVQLVGRPALAKSISRRALLDIVDQSTEVGRAKLLFQAHMRDFAAGLLSIDDARLHARTYEDALVKHFSAFNQDIAMPHIASIGMNIASAVAGAYLGPVKIAGEIGSNIGMGLLSTYVGEKGVLRIAERYRKRQIEGQFAEARTTVQPHVRGMLSALHFDAAVTHPIAAAVRSF